MSSRGIYLIRAYQEALQKLEVVQHQAVNLASIVVRASEALEHWQEVTVSNSGIRFPPEAHVYSIDAKTWPTAQQLGEVLSSWHQMRHEMRNKWSAVPQDRRVGLRPPSSD